MFSTGLVFDESMAGYSCLWDPTYVECPARFTSTLDRCRQLGLVDRCIQLKPRRATEVEILTNHCRELLEVMKATEDEEDVEALKRVSSRYDCVYVHPKSYPLSMLSAGSCLALTEDVLKGKIRNGFALVRPPGHHATVDEICGYCYFNNVALCAKAALDSGRARRVLIVDWDVHHGQGTQRAFYDDDRVLYFSIHRYEYGSWWPELRESDFDHVGSGRGAGRNVNVPLNVVGNDDADYMAAFLQLLMPIASEFSPDLVLVSAGFDPAVGCPEGEQEVTPACFSHFAHLLMSLAGGKVVALLEGGYFLPSLAEGAALTIKTLLGDPCPKLSYSLGRPREEMRVAIANAKSRLRPHWKCLQLQRRDPEHRVETKWLGPPEETPRPAEFDVMCPTPPRPREEDERYRRWVDRLIRETDYSSPGVRVSLCLAADEASDFCSRHLWSLSSAPGFSVVPCRDALDEQLEWLGMKGIKKADKKSVGTIFQALEEVLASRGRSALAVIPSEAGSPDLPVAAALYAAEKRTDLKCLVVVLKDGDAEGEGREFGQDVVRFTIGPGLESKSGGEAGDDARIGLAEGQEEWDLTQAVFRVVMPVGYEFRPDLAIAFSSLSSSWCGAHPLVAHHLSALCPVVWVAEGAEAGPFDSPAVAGKVAAALAGEKTPTLPEVGSRESPAEAVREELSSVWKSLQE